MKPSSDLLSRRVAKVLPSKEGLQKLLATKKIRLYQGFDPTGTRLHLGHSIGLRKLMEFAGAGHEVIFLFGTGTVLVGDPSERASGRTLITQAEIDANIKTWKKQAAALVDFDRVKIMQNGDWLTKLTLKDIIDIASRISAVQLFKRESFTRRIKAGDTIWYHETMYPLLQGYDSVAMDVDLEIGGTDQEFNMLVGRELMRKMKGKEKYVLTTPMIVGIDGNTMSKTTGNCVWLTDTPEDMYGKLMRLPDEHITTYLQLVTDIPLEDIRGLPHKPLENKKRLAFDVTRQFHGESKAQVAAKNFELTIQQRQAPINIPTITLTANSGATIIDAFEQAGITQSRGEAKRLIAQPGTVTINDQPITDINYPFSQVKGTLRVGRRWFEIKQQ